MTRHTRAVVAALLLAPLLAIAPATPAQAITDRWAAWDPITGSANAYATTLRQRSRGFPAAAVATDSRSDVQLPSGASTFLGPSTPPGQKYGTSQGSAYLLLRPRADTAATPSTTTYTFDAPTPDTGWAFALGDIDADSVRVRATDATGGQVPAAEIDSWFKGSFNNAGGSDVPTWDAGSSTLTGNPAARDTNGASGWFEPDVPLTSLTLVFTRRAGFPVYQTWFVSRARPIGGTVEDVSAVGACPVQALTLSLLSPSGEVLATTSPAVDGSYGFGELATQSGYLVRLAAPATCAVVGPAELAVSNRGNDGDPASRADFAVRQVIPQPISGTVRDGDGAPVPGVEITLTRPDSTTRVTTTGPDGSYLFDDNAIDTGYSLTATVPGGYAAGPAGTTISGVAVASVPVTGQDFTVVRLPSVSGTVTGGGTGLGGVQVVLTPVGGGPSVTAVTDGAGSYSIPGVPPGDYTVTVVPPAGFTGATTRQLTLGSDDSTGNDFALGRPGALAGQVLDADTGQPVPGAEVTVSGPGGPTTLTTDPAGGFFLDDLDAGTYTITVTPPAGSQVVGPATLQTTITTAGEIRGGLDFEVSSAATPSPAIPTDSPSTSPSTTPTDSPGSSPTNGTGDGDSGTGTLPDTGGPSRWPLLLGVLLMVVGGLTLNPRRGEHRRARHR